MLEKIIQDNNDLLTDNYKQVTSSYKSDVYIFDNKYILKICSNEENEINFLNEINFYKENKNNDYIPYMYKYNNTIKPYYIITEKLDGISLYNLWYKLNHSQKEKIIHLISDFLKQIHSNKRESNHWEEIMITKISNVLDKIRNLELFDETTLNDIEKIVANSKEYLTTDTLAMIHGDIQFDNIFITPDNNIKIIDFENSSYAPIDYELDSILRMCRKPKEYSNKIHDDYIDLNDYQAIPLFIEKYYPEIFNVNNLKKRLLIYDLYYNLKSYTKHVNNTQIKNNIIELAKKINQD